MTTILHKLEAGDASERELDLLLSVCDRINGKCLCPLGDSDAIAVMSYFDKFRDEFQAHIDQGGCPFHGTSSLDNLLAPVAMHVHDHAPVLS
jgi:NADH-quinone oxidoreductase subunit F